MVTETHQHEETDSSNFDDNEDDLDDEMEDEAYYYHADDGNSFGDFHDDRNLSDVFRESEKVDISDESERNLSFCDLEEDELDIIYAYRYDRNNDRSVVDSFSLECDARL